MKNILILGVAAVQYDAIKHLKNKGYNVHAIARGNDGPGADIADKFTEIDILDLEKVEQYIKDNNIDIVYSVGSDISMPVVSKLSEKLGMKHFVSEETAKICNNKNLMRETLGDGFPGNIRFKVMDEIEEPENLNYPFIVKPTDSQGQRGVALVNNYTEFKKAFFEAKQASRAGLVITEQYISGPEVSVNGYLIDGELKYVAISDRDTWPQFTGLIHKHILPSRKANEDVQVSVKNILEKISNKVGIQNGPVYAQMKIEDDSPYLIEITPRLDGCHMWNVIQKNSGINLLELTFEHLLNNNTAEIKNMKFEDKTHILEFVCQKPYEQAEYSHLEKEMNEALDSFKYYNTADEIRPINGKYEKIGYFVYDKESKES